MPKKTHSDQVTQTRLHESRDSLRKIGSTPFPAEPRQYFERRTGQYNKDTEIEKTRIVTFANMIRAFGAMFLSEPHRTSKNYSALKKRVGKDIFNKDHRMEPYHIAALTLYRIEFMIRSKRLDRKYRPARFHILMAVRLLSSRDPLPRMNSHAMEKYCKSIIGDGSDFNHLDKLISEAVEVVDSVASDKYNRDTIRTEPFTSSVTEACKRRVSTSDISSPFTA